MESCRLVCNAGLVEQGSCQGRYRGVAESTLAARIASGHAFEKHVLDHGQFPGILTPAQFATEIQRIMDNPSASKRLARGRQAYWDEASGTVVIVDPHARDGGAAFKPVSGHTYYAHLK